MAIRKIPMKARPRFLADGSFADDEKEDEERAEDPAVGATLATIRKLLLTDRAMHDKVGCA